jgi:hypothetical protein
VAVSLGTLTEREKLMKEVERVMTEDEKALGRDTR